MARTIFLVKIHHGYRKREGTISQSQYVYLRRVLSLIGCNIKNFSNLVTKYQVIDSTVTPCLGDDPLELNCKASIDNVEGFLLPLNLKSGQGCIHMAYVL